MTIVGNGTNIQFYKNGVSFSTSDTLGTLSTGNSARLLSVGKGEAITNDWDGDISQILIYNRALSSSEVLQNYNAILQKFIRRDNLILSLDAQNTNLYAISTTTAYDVSGNGYNGALTNGVEYVADGNGSWSFDGVDADIEPFGSVDTFSFIQNTGIFTICGSSIRFLITNGGGSSYSQQISNYFLNDNWVFVTIVGNGTNIIYYKNGSLFTTGSAISSFPSGSGTRLLAIGSTIAASSFFWKGGISQTSIYDINLTSEEISTMYNATKTRYGL